VNTFFARVWIVLICLVRSRLILFKSACWHGIITEPTGYSFCLQPVLQIKGMLYVKVAISILSKVLFSWFTSSYRFSESHIILAY
jgi:hypothetical protein